MKNAIGLVVCTCLLLLVDAGVVSNRDSEEKVVQAGSSGGASVAQPHSEDQLSEKVSDVPVENDEQLRWAYENGQTQYETDAEDDDDVDVDDDDDETDGGTFETEGIPVSEHQVNKRPFLQPPPVYPIPSWYLFDSQPQEHLYRSLIGEIRYKLDAIARREASIIKFIKCSCPDASKCRTPYLKKLKAVSLSRDDPIPKQLPIPGFTPYNYLTQSLFGAPYTTDYYLSTLTSLKAAVGIISVRQNIIYQYASCSCNKTNECSQKIKPLLDTLFSIDRDLLSPLYPFGSSAFNQLGFGSVLPDIDELFGLGGEDLTFNKPNVTTFGNGSVSGSVFSGTIGESSRPSGAYYGSYVSSSSGGRQPVGSGVSSGVQTQTSCVGNEPCTTSGSISLSTGGNKPEVVNLPLKKPNLNLTLEKPLDSLTHAIAELGSVTSESLEGIIPANSELRPATSELVASLSETSRIASELINRISFGLLGEKPAIPQPTTNHSTAI